MKKYLVSALAIALVGASIASIAQSTPMDHSSHGMAGMGMQGMKGMDSPDMQAMQKKMGAAKTDEERQALMAEHQKQPGSMKGMDHDAKPGAMDHASEGMRGMNPAEMQAMRESMQKRMSAAKTDEERQALMAEQQKQMMKKRMGMMPM
jgi:hypothetical protein